MIETALEWAGVLPWLLPVTGASVMLAIWISRPLARLIPVHPVHAAALVLSLALVLGATLTPLGDDGQVHADARGGCDLSRWRPASAASVMRLNDAGLNIVLFMPLGAAIGFIPPRRPRLVSLGMAAALPFAIEGAQFAISALGRGCEAADVVDNIAGLAVGFAVGYLALRLTRL
jgi:hypothetical protein